MVYYYQVEGSTTSFTTTSNTTTNAGDWYYYPYTPAGTAAEKKYPSWLQPNDTSGTGHTSMKYCGHCGVYYFNDLHTCYYHCCCCQHHHYHNNHWDRWIVT